MADSSDLQQLGRTDLLRLASRKIDEVGALEKRLVMAERDVAYWKNLRAMDTWLKDWLTVWIKHRLVGKKT